MVDNVFCNTKKLPYTGQPRTSRKREPTRLKYGRSAQTWQRKGRNFFSAKPVIGQKTDVFSRQMPREYLLRKSPNHTKRSICEKQGKAYHSRTGRLSIFRASQNMLLARRKSLSIKDLKVHPTGFEPVTFGSVV